MKIRKEEKDEKEEKKNKKEEFHDVKDEKEYDQIAELEEKFKSLLMKVPGKEREDVLIYGVKVTYLKSKNKIKNGVVFCDDDTNLQFLCPDDPDNLILFDIKLASISDILLGRSNGYLKDIELPIDNNCCMTIKYNDGLKYVDLIFYSVEICEYFISGIIYMMRKKVKEGQNYNIDLISLKRIWRQYDPQRNKYLDLNQFSQFLKDINFDKDPEKVFKDICKENNNNRITFKEFINFYELLVTGEEFEEVFQKYSTDEDKKYIKIKDLIDFFDKEQNEILHPEDAIKLICKYSSKAQKMHQTALEIIETLIKKKEIKINRINIQKPNDSSSECFDENISDVMNLLAMDLFNMRYRPQKLSNNDITTSESLINEYDNHNLNKSKQNEENLNQDNILNNEYKDIRKKLKNVLKLSFRKFVNLLMDHTVNNIFNKNKISRNQDMDHPMTDYFVNSSHNTYLEGNQIIGTTSISMYRYVLDNGTRFVDLDTFDGKENEENEPVITHWHFPVGSIPFKETLIEIKNSAFLKNEYPVILSLENHCGDECQEKMKNYFLQIIGRENLYILDNDTPPLLYPSPNELKKKFIIKNKRKRILGDLVKMQNSYEKNYMNTLEQIHKQNKNQKNELIRTTNSDISLSANDNSENTENKTLKKSKYFNSEIINMSMTPNDNNNNNNKKYDIINEVIKEEENSSESDSSDSGNILSEKADEKIINDTGEVVNKIRSNKYTFMKELPNNPNFILCRSIEMEIIPENINLPQIIKKQKKTKIKLKEEKFERPSIVPLSNLVLKKMREKFDSIESFPPNESMLELEQKYKNLKKIQDIQIGDTKNSNNIKIITIENLANILGMVGVKYHKETFDPKKFLPWECISIAENDILKYISVPENKYKIMEYCTSSFLKIYPDGFRTDSSNQDVVNSWALGCQFCALNLQKTDDDCVLINKMFFKLNGGSKCGYVLKPAWLRKFNEENFKKRKLNPIFKIKFEILSGFHLNLTIPSGQKIKGMFVEVTLRSPNSFFQREHEEQEKKLTTNIVSKNFLHPVFPSNSITFNIYEEELSFIFIKLLSENNNICLGRAAIPVVALNLGYRVVDLYDNTCSKLDEPFLIVRSNKIL